MTRDARDAREDCLHRWVADGKVEHREHLLTDVDHTMVAYVTEYRVVGAPQWHSDGQADRLFPSEKLIAKLALDIAVFAPPRNPPPQTRPQWWVSGMARTGEGFINLDQRTT